MTRISKRPPARIDLGQMSVGEILQAIPGTHARAMTTTDDGPSGRDGLIVIEPMPDRPRPTVAANSARARKKAARRQEARTLRDEGLSISQISVKLKIGPRTVERYLAVDKPPV